MVTIGRHSFEEYLDIVKAFHGALAPGMILGGFMVDLAQKNLPEGEFFDAVCETRACLPDAIQLLTPCTIGNGWLKVMDLGRYALTLYEKFGGEGIRVYVDKNKLEPWSEYKSWFYKYKPKKEQDSRLLFEQIREAGSSVCSLTRVRIKPQVLAGKPRGGIVDCPVCGEPYPASYGSICRGCQGEEPYLMTEPTEELFLSRGPELKTVPVDQAVGRRALHDMTRIIPGREKGAAYLAGQELAVGDICRLQQMGKRNVYIQEDNDLGPEWVHEDRAAREFGAGMAGDGVTVRDEIREGKATLVAENKGLLVVDKNRLEQFNLIPGVMCASRHSHTLVDKGFELGGTRAIPLYLERESFDRAMAVLDNAPLFNILPLRKARVGILVTGSEIFDGLVEDRFVPLITTKVEKLGSEVIRDVVAPDDRDRISLAVRELLASGADLIVTTAGLSVDPDDVTRQGLLDAGATDLRYGAPILPGAMTLLADIGKVPVIGVPACALFHKTTSFELLFPRLLAGLPVTRADLAKMAHGAFCMNCKACTWPKCPFGK
jgi:formylmethanofuran dehydrogenase subunit E